MFTALRNQQNLIDWVVNFDDCKMSFNQEENSYYFAPEFFESFSRYARGWE